MKTAAAVTGKATGFDYRKLILVVESEEADRRRLHYYLTSDRPILVVTDKAEPALSFESDRVAQVKRSSRKAALAAVSDLLDVD